MKIGLLSLGCPKNLVDSEVMMGLAEHAGHELTTDPREADVLIVNTCAFIDAAKQESVDAILEMGEYKRTGRCRRLIVTGCLAERYRSELRAEIPEIDALLGTGEVPDIVRAIGRVEEPSRVAPVTLFRSKRELTAAGSRNNNLAAPTPAAAQPPRLGPRRLPTYIYDADTPRRIATPRHFAYLKIAEGCDYKCAFCVIPTLRGGYRSRPTDSIVREARTLAEEGARELILISQDTTFYGIDRGERGALARLLRELNAIEALGWIRLLYLYPTTIDERTLDAIAECEKVCNYIDLPLQHVSEPVLRRMNRPGNRRMYERLVQRVRGRVPGVTLRTTFIVGFPGETPRDFDELCSFVREVAFDHVGVFTYSHEETTAAFALDDDVPAADKRQRRDAIMELQRRLVARAHRRRVGQTVRVLVDGPAREHPLVLVGRLEGQAPEIDPVVYLSGTEPLRAGDFVEATIVGARGYDLVAHVAPTQ